MVVITHQRSVLREVTWCVGVVTAQLDLVVAARRQRSGGRCGAGERAWGGAAPGAGAGARRRPLRVRRGRTRRSRRAPGYRHTSPQYVRTN